MSKIYFITGTSSGFGHALAEAVLERGDSVVLTARKPEVVAGLAARFPDRAMALPLDVTKPVEVRSAVAAALERFGRIDVLVNNAGFGSLGALEEFSDEQLRSQFEVNFFGAVDVTRAVLPSMRAQRSGHILNITSIGGLISARGFTLYCATKFALEGVSEGLADELSEFGIKVTIVEPGAFRTEFAGDKNMAPANPLPEYDALLQPMRDYLLGGAGQQPGDPRKAAQVMIQAVESENPPLRLILGSDAFGMLEPKMQRFQEDQRGWRAAGEATAFEGAVSTPSPVAG
jgi:NAD(P)-dependent dehydrogenase (short-subunit alcohol dehydrogenase family)